jgi:hypothetical protein
MVNYANGKVYKIEAMNAPEEEKVYVGSTTKQYLSQRMDFHRYDYGKWLKGKCCKTTSFELFEKYGVDNCKIILLETYPSASKDELLSREAHYIRTLNCVNRNIPLKQWHEQEEENMFLHKEHSKTYAKTYYELNKTVINETKRMKNKIDTKIPPKKRGRKQIYFKP